MPRKNFGEQFSQSEARTIRYHFTSNLHLILPPLWSAWNKTADQLSDEVERLSRGDITLSPDEIEMIAGRVMLK